LEYLNAYIRDNPRAPFGYLNRGAVFRMQGKLDKAHADIESILRFAPQNPEAYWGRANIYMAQNLYSQALADYSKAISLAPKNWMFYAARGEALFQMQKLPEALEDCNRSLQRNHEESGVYHLRGLIHMGLNLHAKSFADFAVALRLKPGDVKPLLGQALLHWQLLEYDKALDKLTRAISCATMQKDLCELYAHRVELHLMAGHPFRAFADALRHERHRPDHRLTTLLRPLAFWSRHLLSQCTWRAQSLFDSLIFKPAFICFERHLFARMCKLMPKMGISLRTRQYPGLTATQLVNEGTLPIDPDLLDEAVDCFLTACDAPDAPEVLKKTRAGMDALFTVNLNASKYHILRLLRKNVKGYRVAFLGQMPKKTTDLTACTLFLAEELVWIWHFRSDVFSFRFFATPTKCLMPRAWAFYYQNKPEIDAYLERFCKARRKLGRGGGRRKEGEDRKEKGGVRD
jgi:tetratricopeptide (TPR) repeat protein